MRQFFVLCCLALGLLSGCGFHLRGTVTPLPTLFDGTYVSGALMAEESFARRLKDQIVLSGGKIVTRDVANVIVNVSDLQVSSRQIAESGNGSLQEYERTYNITVTVIDLNSKAQLGSKELSVTRNIQLTDNRVLAGEEQSRITQSAAESALVQAVIRYLKTF